MTESEGTRLVARILEKNLKSTFAKLCAERYGGPITLRRESAPSDQFSSVGFRIRPSTEAELRVHFRIQHAGGNVFDITGEIDRGPSQSFTFSIPDTNASDVPQAPDLTRKVAGFLIDAMEHRVGSSVLERAARNEPTRSRDAGSRSSASGSPETSPQS